MGLFDTKSFKTRGVGLFDTSPYIDSDHSSRHSFLIGQWFYTLTSYSVPVPLVLTTPLFSCTKARSISFFFVFFFDAPTGFHPNNNALPRQQQQHLFCHGPLGSKKNVLDPKKKKKKRTFFPPTGIRARVLKISRTTHKSFPVPSRTFYDAILNSTPSWRRNNSQFKANSTHTILSG